MDNTKKLIVILCMLILMGVLILGSGMYRNVPIIKVNMSLTEKQDGVVDIKNYTIVQDNVNYINRPKRTVAESFPAVIGRVLVSKHVGPWESVYYKGTGNYAFNMAFPKDYIPKSGEPIHITIMVVDKDGVKIGYLMEDVKWK